MKRVVITDGSGQWFDEDAAVKFSEQTRWDGHNHISLATGEQCDHEALYWTKSGKWILNHWSYWDSFSETYQQIEEDQAICWLCVNECWLDDEIEKLPANVKERVLAGFSNNEV